MEVMVGCRRPVHFTLLDYNIDLCKSVYPTLPANVDLQSFNLLTDFALHPEWTNSYDAVYQRLMCAALTAPQWSSLLRNYLDILKPGGWIQICELDPSRNRHIMGPYWSKAVDWAFQLAKSRQIDFEIVQELPRLLKEAGFEVMIAEEKDFSSDNGDMLKASQWYIDTGLAISARACGTIIKEDEWTEFKQGLLEESHHWKIHNWKGCLVVAQVRSQISALRMMHF